MPAKPKSIAKMVGNAKSRKQRDKEQRDKEQHATGVNPGYYQFMCKDVNGKEVELEVVSVVEALCAQDLHVGTSVIYLLRAGRKKGNEYVSEIKKARRWLDFAIRYATNWQEK